MPALLKFLVLLALFLSASHSNAFTSLSSVAGNQVRVNHLTRLQQPMSNPTNEPLCEPIHEPTKWLGQDALLPGNLYQKEYCFECQWWNILNHIKWQFQFPLFLSVLRVSVWLIVGFILIGRQLPTCSTHSILSSLLASKEVSYLPVFSSLHSTVRLQVPEWHVGFALLW